jgi:hypothetical protein
MSARRRPRIALNVLAALVSVAAVAAAVVLALSPSTRAPRHRGSNSRATPPSAPAPAPVRLFSADSVWNQPLGQDARLASDSQALAGRLLAETQADGVWINTYQYSVPAYTVSRDQPTVPVVLDAGSDSSSTKQLAAVLRAGVPIPNGAQAAPGTDQHMAVLQPSTDTMWEFWHMHQVAGVWHASWGGKMSDFSANPGYFTDPPDWGATATSIPLLAGLMLFAELREGKIDHALAISVPETSSQHVLPAQRSDGTDDAADAIPEGTDFRIAPSVNLSDLRLPRLVLMMALAAQRYGMIVRDQSPTVAFYGQQPTAGEANPYEGTGGLFEGETPSELLRDFPWRDLEVVAPR